MGLHPMAMHFKLLFRGINRLKSLTHQTRCYARDPFPNKVSHYLFRAKLIDKIRLGLRSSTPSSLAPLLNHHLFDSFVVTHALRSAPSADAALSLVDALQSIPHFSHTQNTVHALATVLAKSHRTAELKSLIDSVNAGSFRNVRVSFMNLMQWYAATGDLDMVLRVWDEYRLSTERVCTESYNIVMRLYAQTGKDDSEAVQVFYRMISEGAIPNSKTYKVMIEHLVNSGKLESAMDIFKILPLMRIRRTSSQYFVLMEGLLGVEWFEEVKDLLKEMKVDGILPGRAMLLSLKRMQEAGFVQETDAFLGEMLPDERIRSIGCSDVHSDDDDDDDGVDEDEDVSRVSGGDYVDGIQLKPWLDPRALASALQHWSSNEVSALEDAKLVWTTRLFCKILRNLKSPKTAWDFFCWVAYQPGFTHDVYTVQRTLALLARHGHVELVDKLLSKIKREGMRLPFSTMRLIIDFYGLSKRADAALKVFHDDRTLCGPMEGEKNGHHHLPETRGLCLSDVQTVATVSRGPRIGEDHQFIDMRTEACRLSRRCEVTAILVLYGLPRLLTGATLAHEMMHAWLRLNGYLRLRPEVEEGICQVLAFMWLESELDTASGSDIVSLISSSFSSLFSPSSSTSSNKGKRSDFEKKCGDFLKHLIESDRSPVYGGGFRTGRQAVDKYGLKRTLCHIRMTGSFP